MRFSFARLFQSKPVVLYLVLCLFYPFCCLAFIYLLHSPAFFLQFGFGAALAVGIDGRFFYFYAVVQGALAYLLAALVGPGLIVPDITNGALPLYFSRPFSRTEYVLGKASVLFALLSLITWVPGLFLYLVQISVAGWAWGRANAWLAQAIFLGLLVWVVLLCLIALALSAWMKWKIAAGGAILAVLFAGAGFGTAINMVMRANYGALIDVSQVIHTIWSSLFRFDNGTEMSMTQAWTVMAVASALCVVLLLRRVRAFEVVK
jgi:ABC-2 type transport system permease protein